jgi:hypothetical protein
MAVHQELERSRKCVFDDVTLEKVVFVTSRLEEEREEKKQCKIMIIINDFDTSFNCVHCGIFELAIFNLFLTYKGKLDIWWYRQY